MSDSPDSPDPLDPRDELASAYLDGETTADEARRVEQDEDLLARVAALRQVAVAVGSAPEPADDARRESAVAAALATAATHHPGDELAAARARRSARARVLGIAAAIALLVLAVPLLARLGDDSDDDTTAADTSSEALEERAADEAGDDAAAEAGAGVASAPPAAPALGEFDSVEQIAEALGASPLSGEEAPTAGTAQSSADRKAASCAGRYTGVVRVASATVDDVPVLVLVIDGGGDRGRHLVVVDADSCDELADLPL